METHSAIVAPAAVERERSSVRMSRVLERSNWHVRLPVLCAALLLGAFLTGATAVNDTSPDLSDVAKIVSVVAFVGSMVALCMSMIGDAYRL